jgi:hypothetical protein
VIVVNGICVFRRANTWCKANTFLNPSQSHGSKTFSFISSLNKKSGQFLSTQEAKLCFFLRRLVRPFPVFWPRLSDGLFSNQKNILGIFWRALHRLKNVDIFYDHLVYFTGFLNVVWSFVTFCVHFGTFFPVLVSCTMKNLATLILATGWSTTSTRNLRQRLPTLSLEHLNISRTNLS